MIIRTLKFFLNLLSVAIILFLINSCAYFKLKTLENSNFDENSLYSILSTEYKNFAKSELYEMHDEIDANYFAYKALLALNEKKIFLENPKDWNLTDKNLKEALQHYDILKKIIIDDDFLMYPLKIAEIISGFDCWLEQLEENWQIEDINKCKNKFLSSYKNIKALVNNDNVKQEQNDAKKTNDINGISSNKEIKDVPKEITIEKILNVIVYFNYDKFILDNNQLIKLKEIIIKANKYKDKTILINGHTDTKGTKSYNLKLSNKRANFVKQFLKSNNITNNILTVGYGEVYPLVKTGDNVIEEKNRRAEIIIKY